MSMRARIFDDWDMDLLEKIEEWEKENKTN